MLINLLKIKQNNSKEIRKQYGGNHLIVDRSTISGALYTRGPQGNDSGTMWDTFIVESMLYVSCERSEPSESSVVKCGNYLTEISRTYKELARKNFRGTLKRMTVIYKGS